MSKTIINMEKCPRGLIYPFKYFWKRRFQWLIFSDGRVHKVMASANPHGRQYLCDSNKIRFILKRTYSELAMFYRLPPRDLLLGVPQLYFIIYSLASNGFDYERRAYFWLVFLFILRMPRFFFNKINCPQLITSFRDGNGSGAISGWLYNIWLWSADHSGLNGSICIMVRKWLKSVLAIEST